MLRFINTNYSVFSNKTDELSEKNPVNFLMKFIFSFDLRPPLNLTRGELLAQSLNYKTFCGCNYFRLLIR
jgi:hypothetical protein